MPNLGLNWVLLFCPAYLVTSLQGPCNLSQTLIIFSICLTSLFKASDRLKQTRDVHETSFANTSFNVISHVLNPLNLLNAKSVWCVANNWPANSHLRFFYILSINQVWYLQILNSSKTHLDVNVFGWSRTSWSEPIKLVGDEDEQPTVTVPTGVSREYCVMLKRKKYLWSKNSRTSHLL